MGHNCHNTFEAEIFSHIRSDEEYDKRIRAIKTSQCDAKTKRSLIRSAIEKEETKQKPTIDYLLDALPHIHKYADCMESVQTDFNGSKIPQTPSYNIGSIYKSYKRHKETSFSGMSCWLENSDDYIIPRKCAFCESEDLVFDAATSSSICASCGSSVDCIEGTLANASFGQTAPQQTRYAYKRINHFNEWLAGFQAKENTAIPHEVADMVKKEYVKNRFTNPSDVTNVRTRQYLKILKLNKYYEHSPQISEIISGIKTAKMSETQEKKLRMMFTMIQKPFDEVCPPERKNFPSYSYILHKFCELLEYDDLKDRFPLLKSREKLFQLDKIWKSICKKLEWQYISSI